MEELIILSQIFQACVPNRSGMPWPGVVQRADMYLSGRARHNHHTYSPSFISPSGEYFEMVRRLMDRTQFSPDHFVCAPLAKSVRSARHCR